MIKGKGNWGDFLERLLTAVLLTCLIVFYQQAFPKRKLSLAPNQTTSLAQKSLQILRFVSQESQDHL